VRCEVVVSATHRRCQEQDREKPLPERFGALGDFQRGFAYFFVDEAIGGKNDGRAKLIGFALEVADFAAGFFNEEHARGNVPLVEAKFPETVEAAGSNRGEIERRGTVAANAMGALREFAVILEIRAELAIARGKAGAEQACGKRRNFRDCDSFAVERGAFAARGGIQLVVVGIEDHGGEQRVALRQRDGNTETGIVMREIRGAVERIDVPAKFGSGVLAGALFRSDGVARKQIVDAGDNELLGALVGLRDDVHFVAFVANVERSGEFFHENFACVLRDLNGSLEIVFGHRKDFRRVGSGEHRKMEK